MLALTIQEKKIQMIKTNGDTYKKRQIELNINCCEIDMFLC